MTKTFKEKTIKSFVRRTGRITKAQSAALKTIWPLFGVDFDKKKLNLVSLYKRKAPIILEIGFGNGETLVEEAIENPKKFWDEEKEKKYLKDLKKFYKIKNNRKLKKIEQKGFTLKEGAQNLNSQERVCPVCDIFSFNICDDLYMNRYQCCEGCYIKYVEDREERWFSGWRPNK